MGDTAIFSDMGLINEIYRPQVGIVPIGDRFTMGAKTAALACKRFFEFETVIPCHYGTFPIIDQTADKFVAEMGGNTVVSLRSASLRGLARRPAVPAGAEPESPACGARVSCPSMRDRPPHRPSARIVTEDEAGGRERAVSILDWVSSTIDTSMSSR
jgi:hypothetical protein